jgi:hypothetical protein
MSREAVRRNKRENFSRAPRCALARRARETKHQSVVRQSQVHRHLNEIYVRPFFFLLFGHCRTNWNVCGHFVDLGRFKRHRRRVRLACQERHVGIHWRKMQMWRRRRRQCGWHVGNSAGAATAAATAAGSVADDGIVAPLLDVSADSVPPPPNVPRRDEPGRFIFAGSTSTMTKLKWDFAHTHGTVCRFSPSGEYDFSLPCFKFARATFFLMLRFFFFFFFFFFLRAA